MTEVNRRDFVKSAAATTAAATTAAAVTSSLFSPTARAMGANGKINVAAIGFKSRGRHLIQAVKASADKAQLVALCDADQEVLDKQDPDNTTIYRTTDLRKIITHKDVDAIVSATPNHWHALLTVWACQAGKHVYMEKPISHNMVESQAVVKASRKYNRIVQCGFQNRSDSGVVPFFERLHAGEFGKVLSCHGSCHRPRATIGKRSEPLTPPKSVDYDLWLGPAEDLPITRERFHYDWHWDFNTGNGDVGNQGPHEIDLINYALGDPKTLPESIVVAGNRFGWADAGNTPNVMACSFMHGGVPVTFEVMDLKGGRNAPYRKGVGVVIKTENGIYVGGRGGGRYVGNDRKSVSFGRNKSGSQGRDGGFDHMGNFFDAILSNDRSIQASEAEPAANSSSIAHMANISFMLAKEAPAETVEKSFSDHLAERDMIARLRESALLYTAENLGKAPQEPWLLGPKLAFDSSAFAFTGSKASEANALMTRNYRKGYELPAL